MSMSQPGIQQIPDQDRIDLLHILATEELLLEKASVFYFVTRHFV